MPLVSWVRPKPICYRCANSLSSTHVQDSSVLGDGPDGFKENPEADDFFSVDR